MSSAIDDKKPTLVNCVVATSTRGLLDKSSFEQLVKGYRSRSQGKARSITGVVLYEGGSCFQVIEGPEEDVEALYRAISLDKVHRNVVKLIVEPVAERNFDDLWSAHGEGVRALFGRSEGGAGHGRRPAGGFHAGHGRAKRLLRQFVDGRWRLFTG